MIQTMSGKPYLKIWQTQVSHQEFPDCQRFWVQTSGNDLKKKKNATHQHGTICDLTPSEFNTSQKQLAFIFPSSSQ